MDLNISTDQKSNYMCKLFSKRTDHIQFSLMHPDFEQHNGILHRWCPLDLLCQELCVGVVADILQDAGAVDWSWWQTAGTL